MFKPYGIIAALVTPLDKEENLMEGALKEVIGYALEGGVHGASSANIAPKISVGIYNAFKKGDEK